MVKSKDYKEVCQWATLLGIYSEFTYEDFVLPLTLQDKCSLTEEYLDGNTAMQKEFVSFLDSLLSKSVNVRIAIEPVLRRLDVPDVKVNKLHHKPLGKLIARLCKKYSLPSEVCPNLNLKRNEGALQFLLHKRFIDQSLNYESWTEMLQEAVQHNKDMQKELISLLVNYGDPNEAHKWALFYKVPSEHWPLIVQHLNTGESSSSISNATVTTTCEEEYWDNEVTSHGSVQKCQTKHACCLNDVPSSIVNQYEPIFSTKPKQNHHKLNLPHSNIILVDTVDAFEHMLQFGLNGANRVGIDSEWKPYFGTQRTEIALIQISTKTFVYLLDVVALGTHSPVWRKLSLQLFENHEILKLGYGLYADMEKIQSSLKLNANLSHNCVGWLDLQLLTRALGRVPSFRYPFAGEPGCGDGLSALVQLCLGANLDKANQFSNWELRPLRMAQIIYAALDAHCLLEVHDVIINTCLISGIRLQDICDRLTYEIKSPKKKNKKRIEKRIPALSIQPASPFVDLEPRNVESIKVVCDSMVEGLAKALRRCGVDAVSIDNNQEHEVCVQIATNEQRFILTRGITFNRLYQYVPLGHCYRITSDTIEDQLKETLEYFNIQVKKPDIFSRCQMCNSNEFMSLSQKEMKLILSGKFDADIEESEDLLVNNRSWQLARGSTLKDTTVKGVKIQANLIPDTVFQNVTVFYVCQGCGKCYWDGTHFERVLTGRLKDIVES